MKMTAHFKTSLILTICVLMILPVGFLPKPTHAVASTSPPNGAYFDHIVIITLENTPYNAIFGSNSTPFLNRLQPYSSTIPKMNNYMNGTLRTCSAGCYQQLTDGGLTNLNDTQVISCNGCQNVNNLAAELESAGLSTALFCEDGCYNFASHFPWILYNNTANACATNQAFTCTGQTGTSGDALYKAPSSNPGNWSGISNNVNPTLFNYMNGSNPANFIWFTPDNTHQMHTNTISTGDQYVQSLLVGTGSITNPAPGSLLDSNIFTNPTFHTMLYLWWDEPCGNVPGCGDGHAANLQYGYMVRENYTSTETYADEYSSLHTILTNWGLPPINNDGRAHTINDIFLTMPAAPLLTGWGGVGLDEVSQVGSSGIHSLVFPGQLMSQMEEEIQSIQERGMNTVRVAIDATCGNDDGLYGPFNAAQFASAISIAQHYGMWIILEYHGYKEPFIPAQESCWANLWSGITSQFASSYSQIIWEPINEPNDNATNLSQCTNEIGCVAYLSGIYQSWINQTRNQGDQHWIVVQSVCSFGCGFTPSGDGNGIRAIAGYPTVTDPLNQIFLSIHSYMDYNAYSKSWNNTTAASVARGYLVDVLGAIQKFNRPFLNTEGGAHPIVGTGPPDTVVNGSAGYTKTTFNFIQDLTSLYDNNPAGRLNYVWWVVGSWTDTQDAGDYGALQCQSNPIGYGCILQSKLDPGPSLNQLFIWDWATLGNGQFVSISDASVCFTVFNRPDSYSQAANYCDFDRVGFVDIVSISILFSLFNSGYIENYPGIGTPPLSMSPMWNGNCGLLASRAALQTYCNFITNPH